MSEDCLSINVFRPAGLNATAKLPVMVWIYGGSFLSGSSTQYNPALLVAQSVRMVSNLNLILSPFYVQHSLI